MARGEVARGLVFFADAANNDREGTVTLSAAAR